MVSPNEKPMNAGMSSVQAPSPVTHQNDSSIVASSGGDNDLFRQKFEDDIKLQGKKILYHEENIKYLNKTRGSFDHKIADMQATLVKHQSLSKGMTTCKVLKQKKSLKETIKRIMQHENSAASLLCHMTGHIAQQSSKRDILGVLATLGHVDNIDLSRLLSEYLGQDTMLALVCKSYMGIQSMETYDEEGSINKTTGIYWLGACEGKTIGGRFDMICLEKIKPYAGEFMPDDPQRRLVLLEPKLPNGESPPGFLGFAVNMIYIDSENLSFVTSDGYGLRETLFHSLFSRLQVYRTRADMLQALPFIYDGAISLDGGIIRSPGVFVLGKQEEIDVTFGIWFGAPFPSKDYIEIEKEMNELKWKRETMKEDIQREKALLAHAKSNFEVKKKQFINFMAQRLFDQTQYAAPAGSSNT